MNQLSQPQDDLLYKDATELIQLIRKKKLSCRELMQAYLKRKKSVNPKINAIVLDIEESKALAMAEEADRAIAQKKHIGPLHGIPLAAKEMLAVKGWKQSFAWKAGAEEPQFAAMGMQSQLTADGMLAKRMRAAGVLFVGKTNMPEFAFGSHSKNELYGISRNPYDLSKSVGGSSGGAAAVLAAGMLPLADGSDLGGSLRNPASFCNVIGFRPSIGRIPNPEAGWAARMATEGPMARSVDDIALLLSVQAGPHTKDPFSIQQRGDLFTQNLDANFSGMRLGWTPDFGKLPVQDTVKKVSATSLRHFQDLGMEVDDQFPNMMEAAPDKGEMDAMSVFRILRSVRLASNVLAFRKLLGKEGIRKYMSPVSQYQMIEAHDEVNMSHLFAANENRHRIYQLFMRFFETHDFLVCPTAQVLPFDVETDYVRQINGQAMANYLEWMSICCIISITGLPVISMPVGFSEEGLPVGIQIIGKPGADLSVLQLAKAFERRSQASAKYHPPAI